MRDRYLVSISWTGGGVSKGSREVVVEVKPVVWTRHEVVLNVQLDHLPMVIKAYRVHDYDIDS